MTTFSRPLARAALALTTVLSAGCASWLPAPTPMRTLPSRAQADKPARCLLVLLPGMGDSETDFTEHGFIAALRARKLSVDTVSANATIGYYARRSLLERVDADVLGPVRGAGYQEIWFAGISMGGLGSLLVAKSHGHEVAGVILLAPYLGDDDVVKEIATAGGVARWQPPAVIDKDDYQRELWRWLKGATGEGGSGPPIYLGAGDADRFASAHRLLAAALPKERVFHTPGKHDWGPWSLLWADFLDHSDFREHCGSTP